ncbi:zinc-binding dehydrogenase [Mycetocola zhadangensis]|uniref:Alcohol dehydrogenase n=1 Tax=Mycetocola zhadangensis TaxID=1164595 RepID=A0A3L7J615_9MICO|nr:zinc-binding dehydrogenase [Mycetocola zhadangensis]RLQ85974.1 alcohol dehydrogenase [Mycetocola zhadangensis]GGE87311.1 alcohol dehydrogenase [Mycetocola zhadangensis]
MRAVYYDSFSQLPTVASVADPTAPDGGAVIAVEATGLCRSDVHAWEGHDDGVALPHVPGHEFVGRIESVGEGVTRFRPGQRVTVPFVCACGSCPECASGNGQVCRNQTQPGFTHWGSYAERVVVTSADLNLIEVPAALDPGAAAILGCRFATSYRGLAAQARVVPGEWVVVVGCGGVGLSAVMIATALGARVIGIDISEKALQLAATVGAEHVINSATHTDNDVVAAVRDLTGGGAQVSLEALGRERTTALAIRSLAKRGRHVQVGLFSEPPRIPMAEIVAGELTILGSHGMSAAEYPAMLDLVASGRLRPQDLVTATIGLDAAPAAMVAMSEGRNAAGVTIIRPDVR